MEEKKVDRRVRKTKRQLRLALTKLLQEKPIKDITVREIADMVDINRGTFYLHYKDVYDMLEQVEAEMFEEFNQILNAQPSIVNAENPYPILNDIFHFFINYSDMAIALLGPNGDHAFVNRLKAIVRKSPPRMRARIRNASSISMSSSCTAVLDYSSDGWKPA